MASASGLTKVRQFDRVRRCLVRALDASAGGPATLMDLSERVRVLGARLSPFEKSHHALHRKVHVIDRLSAKSTSDNPTPCRRAKKLK